MSNTTGFPIRKATQIFIKKKKKKSQRVLSPARFDLQAAQVCPSCNFLLTLQMTPGKNNACLGLYSTYTLSVQLNRLLLTLVTVDHSLTASPSSLDSFEIQHELILAAVWSPTQTSICATALSLLPPPQAAARLWFCSGDD